MSSCRSDCSAEPVHEVSGVSQSGRVWTTAACDEHLDGAVAMIEALGFHLLSAASGTLPS